MDKEAYIIPEMEIIEFETEDVIITSGNNTEGEYCMGDNTSNSWRGLSPLDGMSPEEIADLYK